jgi:cytochrome oxidase Cu insertion factor (SCO1/SenC/PrrC family)
MTVAAPSRPTFSLVDHDGRTFTDANLHGAYSVIFFGFTNCVRVCPGALGRLSGILTGLKEAAEPVKAYYVSVDPDRDAPDVMKAFLEAYPGFTGLTGTQAQIDVARREFRVFAKAKEDETAPGGYVVSHTAITYLLNRDGYIVDHFNDSVDAETVTARILKKMRASHANDTTHDTNKPESLGILTRDQVASIRHIGNLARQLKGDWTHMMGGSDMNDGFGAFRYQLAYMFYALALSHFHRLPAAPGLFRETMERIIAKMLEADVWFYWHDASVGGGFLQTPAKEMSYDPIKTDNIMYSAYVQVMSAMYNSLFDDDRYTKPGALTMVYDTFLFGPADGYKFEWDQKSINDQVYWNMVQEGYIGVACEPWCIYQICNQVPILGFRLNDALSGETDVASEVTKGYVKAWEDACGGILTPEGGFNTFYRSDIKRSVVVSGPSGDAWCGLMMNAWNHELVQRVYNERISEFVVAQEDGMLSVVTGGIEHSPLNRRLIGSGGLFGWIAAWAAEMGDENTKNGLLAYADKYLNPITIKGGLMYPRNDSVYDKQGKFAMVTPILSNAILPLTRLNVKHGLKRLYENPWAANNREHYGEPALVEVDFDVDVYRAVYVKKRKRLLFDLAVYEEGRSGSVALDRVFGRGDWTLRRDGKEIARGSSKGLQDANESTAGIPVKQDGQFLRVPVIGTKVVSFELQCAN